MGQENSTLVDPSTPTQTLSERSLKGVAQLIKDGKAKRIVVMTGAGISTAAGIPDFRSPKTGLYHNLARLNLPHAEAVFDIEYFRRNPNPFYVLAKELYPGNFHPTVSHAFISLLAKRGLLRMLFTQNIDCLERAAGVPGDRIVEAHGSFATQRCIECRAEFPDDEMKKAVVAAEPPACPQCGGLVKPDIVFFGEQLPQAFHQNRSVPATADLALVLGTSLTVQPFASLPTFVADHVPRVLFNLERVGDLGSRTDDVLCLGSCDEGVRQLADELGWRAELEQHWRDVVGDEEAERQLASAGSKSREREAEEEMEQLVEAVGEKLEISGDDGAEDAAAETTAGSDKTPTIPAEASTEDGISKESPTVTMGVEKVAVPAKSPAATTTPADKSDADTKNTSATTDSKASSSVEKTESDGKAAADAPTTKPLTPVEEPLPASEKPAL